MDVEGPKKKALDFLIEAYQNRNHDILKDILHPEYQPDNSTETVGHIMGFDFSPGLDKVKERLNAINKGIDNLKFEILDILANEDTVHIVYFMKARHIGTYLGVPATQKEFKALGLHFFKFKDGLIYRIGIIQDHYKVLLDLSKAVLDQNEEDKIQEYIDNLRKLKLTP